jgi:hypothetical protein
MSYGIAQTLLDTLDLRRGSVINENEIFALKRRWGPTHVARHRIDRDGEYQAVAEILPMQISDEQAIKGIDWWRAICYGKTGKRRDTSFTRELQERHWHVIENAHHFKLVDFNFVGQHYSYLRPLPVYRMIASDGHYFDYVGGNWQTGGMEVLS